MRIYEYPEYPAPALYEAHMHATLVLPVCVAAGVLCGVGYQVPARVGALDCGASSCYNGRMDLSKIPLSRRGRARVQNMIEFRRKRMAELEEERARINREIDELLDKRNNMDTFLSGEISV